MSIGNMSFICLFEDLLQPETLSMSFHTSGVPLNCFGCTSLIIFPEGFVQGRFVFVCVCLFDFSSFPLYIFVHK